MNICIKQLKLKHKSNICDFEGILKTECNLRHLARNFRICMTLKEIWQTRRAGLLNVKRGTFKCEGEMNGHMVHYEQVFTNVFERRDSKCCAVLMRHF